MRISLGWSFFREKRLSIAPSDIFIVMSEPPLENWGFNEAFLQIFDVSCNVTNDFVNESTGCYLILK